MSAAAVGGRRAAEKCARAPSLGWVALALSLSLLSVTAWPSEKLGEDSPGNHDVLTRVVAEARSRQIEGVSYGFWLSLDPAQPRFRGRATVRFSLKEGAEAVSKTLPIELRAAEIESVLLNGARWSPKEVADHYQRASARILLDVSDLKPGENRLEVSYSSAYGVPGFGLQRWKDSQDQAVYLTGTFEPYSAHWVVPVFDQPDLKATQELTVEVPKDWLVVSGAREREVQVRGGLASWVFPPTKPMSAYALSLHAGPFRVFKGEAEGVDLRLLVRKSLQTAVVASEWWEVLGRGIRFFQGRFAFPLPAPKLDVVFIPEVPGTANEATGTLVFEESLLTKKGRERKLEILKELGQLWFGNLVSMRWWNGLWLKEALSSFVARWALEQEFQDPQVWPEFVTTGKAEALYADRQPGAHPIDVSVKHTDEVLPNLDVYTREKGIAVLKQVYSWVDEEGFQEALQRYFARYAHRVTTLGDFAHALEESADLKESSWRRSWLQTPGHPVLTTEWSCRVGPEGGRGVLEKLTVKQLQKAPRWLKVKVALLGVPESVDAGPRKKRRGRRRGAPVTIQPGFQASPEISGRILEVAGAGASLPVSRAEGAPCPLGVLVDPQAEAFVETRLDSKTDALLASGGERALWLEPVVRAGVWQARIDALLSGEAPLRPGIEAIVAGLRSEKDSGVQQLLFQGLVGAGTSRRMGLLRALPEAERRVWGERLKVLPSVGKRWPLTGLGVEADRLASLEKLVSDPKAPGAEQLAAAERLAASRFWGEMSAGEWSRFQAWLASVRRALDEVDQGADPGPRFGGDEERIEDLAEGFWPFSCENRPVESKGLDPELAVESAGGGPTWLSLDLQKIRARTHWESGVCARLRASLPPTR